MTTISDQIRALARTGMRNAEIARQLGVSDQRVSGVLRLAKAPRAEKPRLTVERLMAGGFTHTCRFEFTDGMLCVTGEPPKDCGVYAFVGEGRAFYVGVSARGIVHRMKQYCRPGPTQTTNIRMRQHIIDVIFSGRAIDIWTACPGRAQWNGLPIDLSAGLEAGLIQTFDLPLNKRGAH